MLSFIVPVLGRRNLQREVQTRKSGIVQRQQLIGAVLDGRLGVHEVVNPGAAHAKRAGFLQRGHRVGRGEFDEVQ